MIPGMRGTLLSPDALAADMNRLVRPAARPGHAEGRSVRTQLLELHHVVEHEAGPAWPARLVFDRIAAPFCRALGFDVLPGGGDTKVCRGSLHQNGSLAAVVIAFAFGQEAGTLWRDSVRAGIGVGVRWCYCFTGPALRVFDASRTHSRRYVEFELGGPAHGAALDIAITVLSSPGALQQALALSERHRAAVRDSLQVGVHDALGHLTSAFATATRGKRYRGRAPGANLLDESLVVVYRVLFLLFAEARGLVPAWHPTFRDSYTIDSLRGAVETLPRPRGVWEALQAMARLAHRGCRAGSLRVPPFNGRLFSPTHAPLDRKSVV